MQYISSTLEFTALPPKCCLHELLIYPLTTLIAYALSNLIHNVAYIIFVIAEAQGNLAMKAVRFCLVEGDSSLDNL